MLNASKLQRSVSLFSVFVVVFVLVSIALSQLIPGQYRPVDPSLETNAPDGARFSKTTGFAHGNPYLGGPAPDLRAIQVESFRGYRATLQRRKSAASDFRVRNDTLPSEVFRQVSRRIALVNLKNTWGQGMLNISKNAGGMGATITGIDLSQPLSKENFASIFRALGEHSVLCFPKQQSLTPESLRDFSANFGYLQKGLSDKGPYEPGVPEVSILSNIVRDGKPIGLGDAGQDWHTDMSYNQTVGFTNVLHALVVPRRDGRVLGNTVFADMYAAYDDLSDELKERLKGLTSTHDFNKFWEEMRRRPGSTRDPLTPEERAKRPPSVHPIFLTHPITGRTVLYCNPGYAIRINELPEAESDDLLETLFKHQLNPKYQYAHSWNEGDVLMWDHISTLHNAIADYAPHEHRLIKRCQVMADKVFDPAFVSNILSAAPAA